MGKEALLESGTAMAVAIQRTCWPARSIFTIPAVGVDNHPQKCFLFLLHSCLWDAMGEDNLSL